VSGTGVLKETERRLDELVGRYCVCKTCRFFEQDLFGYRCVCPEYPVGELSSDDGSCESHELNNKTLQDELEKLQEKYMNAWQIVEGFLYR
jgi:hypothetical protein